MYNRPRSAKADIMSRTSPNSARPRSRTLDLSVAVKEGVDGAGRGGRVVGIAESPTTESLEPHEMLWETMAEQQKELMDEEVRRLLRTPAPPTASARRTHTASAQHLPPPPTASTEPTAPTLYHCTVSQVATVCAKLRQAVALRDQYRQPVERDEWIFPHTAGF